MANEEKAKVGEAKAEEKQAAKAGKPKAAEPVPVVSEPGAERPRRALSPLFDFDQEFERAFENFFKRGWPSLSRWEFPKPSAAFGEKVPNVNVIDRDDEVLIEAELPGVKKDDVDVSISENTVTIKASTRREEEKEEGEFHRREISTSHFARTLPLPAVVEGDKAKAEFKDGMLKLTLPKSEQSKRVSIKVD